MSEQLRDEFVKEIASSVSKTVILERVNEAAVLRFENDSREVTITVPDALDVREFFVDISEFGVNLFSDWRDVYRIGNESEEELEIEFRKELTHTLNELLNKNFRVVEEGKWLKTKKLEFE